MGDCSLFSFLLKSFRLSGIKEPITVLLMQNIELEALKPHQVESSTIDQSTPCPHSQPSMACIPIRGYNSSFQLRQAGDGVSILFNSNDSLATPLQDNHEQLYAALFQTVKPGDAMRDPLSGASGKQLRHTPFLLQIYSSTPLDILLYSSRHTPLDILLQTYSSRHSPLEILLYSSRHTTLLLQKYSSTPLDILLYSSRNTPLLPKNTPLLLYTYSSTPSKHTPLLHSDILPYSSISENFANYFLKTKASNTCITVLNIHVKGYIKAYVSQSGKTKAQGVATLQIRPCIKN